MSKFQKLCEAAFAGKIIQVQVRLSEPEEWADLTESPEKTINRIVKFPSSTYRIKPDINVITYRIYLDADSVVQVWRNLVSQDCLESSHVFIKWLGDEQTIEVEL